MKMKKCFIALMALLLVIPFLGNSVSAENEVEPVEVKITEFALDGFGSFVNFFKNPATLSYENGEIYLEFSHSGIGHLLSVDVINGNEVSVVSESQENDLRTYKVKLDGDLTKSLKFESTLPYKPTPYTGTMELDQNVVEEFIDTIENYEKEIENNNNDNNNSNNDEANEKPGDNEEPNDNTDEKDSDNNGSKGNENDKNEKPGEPVGKSIEPVEVKITEFALDGFGSFVNFFKNPATLSYENGEIYLEFSHSGIGHLLSVDVINGNEVSVVSESQENDLRTYKVKLDGDLTKSLKFESTLPYKPTPYTGEMELDQKVVNEFLNTIGFNEEDSGKEEKVPTQKVKAGETTAVEADTEIQVEDTNVIIKTPSDLPEGTEITIKVNEKDATIPENLEVAGAIIDVTLIFPKGTKNNESFTLTLPYDSAKYNKDEVGIYYFNESTKTWEKQEGAVVNSDGTITLEVTGFSKYAVLAEEKQEQQTPEAPVDESNKDDKKSEERQKVDTLIPDKVYEIVYTLLKDDRSAKSIADQYFKKPGILLEKGDKKYVQFTITNADLVKELSNAHGHAIVVKENKDGSIVVQLRVNDDLSDMMLNMRIIVPGLYDNDYDTILVFDKESIKEIDKQGYNLVGSENKNNSNGPLVEEGQGGKTLGGSTINDQNGTNEENKTPNKPVLGDGEGEKESTAQDSNDLNPKTGDTTAILMYSLLLVAAGTALFFQLRRRFAKQ